MVFELKDRERAGTTIVWRVHVASALAVFFGAVLSRWISPGQSLSLIWLPAGIVFAVYWKYGWTTLLSSVAALLVWSILTYGNNVPVVAAAIASETLAAVFGTAALRTMLKRTASGSADTDDLQTRLRWLLRFYAAVVFVAAPIAALVGSIGFVAGGVHAGVFPVQLFVGYWILEALAIMLIAPAILVWLGPSTSDVNVVPFSAKEHSLRPPFASLDSVVLLLVLLLVIGLLLLRVRNEQALENAVALFYILAMAYSAMRHNARTTYTTLVVSAFFLCTALSLDTSAISAGGSSANEIRATIFTTVVLVLVTTLLTQVLQAVSSDRLEAFTRLRDESMRDVTTGLLNEFGFDQWLQNKFGRDGLLIFSVFFGQRGRINALTQSIPLLALRSSIGSQLSALSPSVAAHLSGEHYALVYVETDASATTIESIALTLRNMNVLYEDKTTYLYPAVAALRLSAGVRPPTSHLIASLGSLEERASRLEIRPFVVHQFSHEIETKIRDRARYAAQVERLLRSGNVVLHAQSIITVGQWLDRRSDRHRSDVSIEILCRLRDEAGNLMPPHEFLPAVEQLRLSRLLDREVVELTFRWFAANRDAFSDLEKCSINLSADTLSDNGFSSFALSALRSHGLDPKRFCFEITESNAIGDASQSVTIVEELRAAGFRVSIDDFGTGFATYSYLKRYAFDELKIDGSFVKTIERDSLNAEIVASIVTVAKTLGVKTVAEYVSTPEIAQRVCDLGVDYLQGYAVSEVQPLDHFFSLIRNG